MVTMKSTEIEGADPVESDGGGGGRVMRPCDIPIYGFPHEQRQRTDDTKEDKLQGTVRSGVKTARLALREVMGPLGEVYETGKIRSASAYEQGTFINDVRTNLFHQMPSPLPTFQHVMTVSSNLPSP